MTSCASCGNQLSEGAARCPVCQRDAGSTPNPASSYKPSWLGGADAAPAPAAPKAPKKPAKDVQQPQPKKPKRFDKPKAAQPAQPKRSASDFAPTRQLPATPPTRPDSSVFDSPRPTVGGTQFDAPRNPGSASFPSASSPANNGAMHLPPQTAYTTMADIDTAPRGRSRGILAVVLVAAVLLGGGYFAFDRFSSSGDVAGPGDSSSATVAAEAFGSPVAVDATVTGVTGAEKLNGALFPVGCEAAQGSATGVAYVVAFTGVPKGESSALASAGPLAACLVGRSAYLHDGANSLRVLIAAYDPETSVVRLQIPAPLPGQAVRLVDQAGLSLVGSIVGGTQTLTQEVSGQRQAPGSPLLDNEGHAIGIIVASGERILTGRLCGSLLSC